MSTVDTMKPLWSSKPGEISLMHGVSVRLVKLEGTL
jgi:hypothetical protein